MWYDVIRPKILLRDNYKCCTCKAKHHSIGYRDNKGTWIECDVFMIEWCKTNGIKVKRMYLQISHKNHNPSDNNETNLWTLCPRCHLSFDKSIRMAKRISPK